MKNWRDVYRILATLALAFGLWGVGRVALAVHQPMGGFLWYYDEAVSGGWIVNWDTGQDWSGITAGLRRGDRILAIENRSPGEFGDVYRQKSIGDSVTYRVRRDGQILDIENVPIVPFTWGMFIHGMAIPFLSGLIFWLLSAFVHLATPESEAGYTFSFFTAFGALIFFCHAFSVSVNIPYYPQSVLFFTWKPSFALMAATGIHFAAIFPPNVPQLPRPLTRRGICQTAYTLAVILIAVYVAMSLPWGSEKMETLAYTLNLGSLFIGLLVCIIFFGLTALKSDSFIARHQARIMLVGWLINALQLLPLLFKLIFPHLRGPSWNIIMFLGSAIPLSMVYAILRYRLFSVRLFLLRLFLHLVPVLGFSFVYLPLYAILNHVHWFERVQAQFTALTYQHIDLRATVCTLLAALAAFRLYHVFRHWSGERLYGLESRLSSILLYLCDWLHVPNGYIALCEGETLRVQIIHNMALPQQTLDRQTALEREQGIALKVPLKVGRGENGTLLGVLALGARPDGQTFTSEERAFLQETVAERLSASLWHIRQLEQFSNAADNFVLMARELQREERQLQRDFTLAFAARPEEITVAAVKRTLRALSRVCRGDLSELGKSPLADLWAVHAGLGAQGQQQLTYHQRAHSVQTALSETIEALKPAAPQDLNDDRWLYYLILKRAFVQGQGWRRVAAGLGLSDSTYYRKREAAIRALAAQLREWEHREGEWEKVGNF